MSTERRAGCANDVPFMVRHVALKPLYIVSLLALTTASEAQDKVVSPKVSGEFASGQYLQMLLGLLVVIAMIYGCAWLVKKMNGGSFNQSGKMRVLSGLSLGARERAVLVDIAGKQMLLGVAPGRVTTLHVFDEPVISQSVVVKEHDFAAKLKGILLQGTQR